MEVWLIFTVTFDWRYDWALHIKVLGARVVHIAGAFYHLLWPIKMIASMKTNIYPQFQSISLKGEVIAG